MQLDYDRDIGTNDQGERFLFNIQPVIAFSLNAAWNPISRAIWLQQEQRHARVVADFPS
jgi:hypothetical protein